MAADARWDGGRIGWFAPFPSSVPVEVREQLVHLQIRRLHAIAPLLCLTVAATAVSLAVALGGSQHPWQRILPPAIIVSACAAIFLRFARRPKPQDSRHALAQLRITIAVAIVLGSVAGLWCVAAFASTGGMHSLLAPVFIALCAMACANCLACVPRSAIAAMATALSPICVFLFFHGDLALRSVAIVLVLVAVLKSQLAIARFDDMVGMLTLQSELDALAHKDPLTGLANRRAFLQVAQERLERGEPLAVAVADLNNFKAANDTFGHHVGDAILQEVANRMARLAVSAVSIARLGGDEFALLFDARAPSDQVAAELAAIRQAASLPHFVGGHSITVTLAIGHAGPPRDSGEIEQLMQAADRRLYLEKAGSASRQIMADIGTADIEPIAPHGRRRWRRQEG